MRLIKGCAWVGLLLLTVACTTVESPALSQKSAEPTTTPTATHTIPTTLTLPPTSTVAVTVTHIESDTHTEQLVDNAPFNTTSTAESAAIVVRASPTSTPVTDIPVTPTVADNPQATTEPQTTPTTTVSPTPEPAAATSHTVSPVVVTASEPTAYETTITISTYGYEAGFVPTTEDDPIFPYPRIDHGRVTPSTSRSYRAVVLENGYVSVTILPDLGGRVYRLVDKATGRELLYQNPVIKPTNWGFRGWWLAAGGIEWAFPVEEHGLNEWRPWQYSIGYSEYGLAVFVSDNDDRTGMTVGANISLDANHSYVTVQPWARNDTVETHEYELWANAMVALNNNTVTGETQFIIPTGQATVHSTGDGGLPGSGGAFGWPTHGGRDLSWYGNWSNYLGFFVPTGSADFVSVYDHGIDQGIVRVSNTHGWPSGTKIFGPGTLSPSLWTDDGSSYVEVWSGATPSFGSKATLAPGQSMGWTEHWYPVHGLGGLNFANQHATLRISPTGNGTDIALTVTHALAGRLALYADGVALAEWPVDLQPGQTLYANWTGTASSLGVALIAGDGTIIAQSGSVP